MDQAPIDDKSGSGSNVPMSVNNDRASSASIHNSTQSVVTLLLLLLILLAFGLRVFALERQSMWSDEGLSYYRATLPTAEVLKGLIVIDGVETRDTNPPLYFLLLHFWETWGVKLSFPCDYQGYWLERWLYRSFLFWAARYTAVGLDWRRRSSWRYPHSISGSLRSCVTTACC